MKKIFPWLFLISLIIVAILISISLYSSHHDFDKGNPNDFLASINYAVQIAYNLSYFIIAVAVLVIAYSQINKTREATTIQTLTKTATKLTSKGYFKRRRELAEFILSKGKNDCGNYHIKVELEDLKNLSEWNDSQKEQVAIIKNKFEAVLYDLVIPSYYSRRKKIYNIEDIYFLFSYEVQRFWILAKELGYIDFIRFNKIDGENDFYKGVEILFKETLKHEIKKEKDISFYDKIFYCKLFRFDRLFNCERNKFIKSVNLLEERKTKNIDLFLLEEKNL